MAQSGNRKRTLSSSGSGHMGEFEHLILSLNHTSPSQVGTVCQKVKAHLKNLSSEEAKFVEAIDGILTMAYGVDRQMQSTIAKLLLQVSELQVTRKPGSHLSVYQIVSKSCQTLPTSFSDTSLSELYSALPFLDDLQRLKMLNGRSFLIFAKWLMTFQGALPKTAVLCMYEIMRTVDKLIDDGIYSLPKIEEENTWKPCVGRVQHSLKTLETGINDEIKSFFLQIKQKGGWARKVSRKKDPPKQATSKSRPAKGSTNTSKTTLHGERKPAFSRLLEKMRHILFRLLGHPENVTSVTEEIRRFLEIHCKTETKFRDAVFALLTLANEANDKDRPTYLQLLQILQKHKNLRDEKGKLLKVRTYISGWAMRLRSFQKVDDVVKFRQSLPLINALFQQKLVISGVFKYYASEVADNEDEVSMLALYEILLNVDRLAEAKVWKYKQDEAAFYEECCCSLGMACQTDSIKDVNKTREISQFLARIPSKGGWHRATIARYLKKSVNNLQPPTNSLVSPAPQEAQPPTEEDAESDGEDDDSVILVAASFGNGNKTPSVDEGFEEKPQPLVEEVTISLDETPLPNENDNNANLEEKIGSVLKSLADNPEGWLNSTSEIETLLQSLTSKMALKNCAKQIWQDMSNASPQVLPVYLHLLDAVQAVSVTTKKGHDYSLKMAFTSHVQNLQNCSQLEQLNQFCSDLRLSGELCRVNILEPNIFHHFIAVVRNETVERSVKPLFIFEILRNIDQLIDDRVLSFSTSDEDVAFYEKVSSKLKKACNAYLKDDDRTEEMLTLLDNVDQKGGWARKVKTKKKKHQEDVPETSHANFCAFLETNFLKNSDGIMTSVCFMKTFLLRMESPLLFAEAVETMLNRLFELNINRITVELAVKLCAELSQVNNDGGKSFITILQETCVKLFSQKHRQEAEDSVLKLAHEVQSTASSQEQIILVEKMERLENKVKDKYAGCARLIARLYTEKLVPFNFFLSFADCLLSIRTDDMIESLLEVLSIAGKQFEHEARVANCMEMWWTNFFNELTQMEVQFDTSPRRRSIILEILLIKMNDWPISTLEQLAARKLKFMLLELTPALTNQPLKYSSALNRVRSFLNECPPEYGRALFGVMLTEFQSVLDDLAQSQLRIQQQQQHFQAQPIMYQYPSNTSPWLMPTMTVYNNAASQQDSSVVKVQPANGGDQPSTSAARVVSITSLPYNSM